MKSFDLIIRNGCICDGTGNPSRHADVGIVGDRIEAIGKLSDATAKETVDASGKVVAPGFIDMHNHVDHAVLAFPDEESYIMQGVTTSVVGNCGLSMAPVSDAHRDEVRKYLKPFLDKKPDTKTVICPVCQAALGQCCRNAAGIVTSTPHVPRQRLAFRKFYAEQEQEGTTS